MARMRKPGGVEALKTSIPELIRQGTQSLQEITGLRAVAVVSMSPEESGWKLGVELLERESVPDTMDVLAVYDAFLDADGRMVRFERTGLRHRGDTDS